MPYVISLDATRLQLDVVHRMLASSYWSPGVARDVVERAFAHSVAVGAFDEATGTQVGVARVVTDHATFAWLADVFVDEGHRGHGLAKRMLAALLDDPRLRGLRRWCLATRDAHGLYERFGFAPVKPGSWMERRAT